MSAIPKIRITTEETALIVNYLNDCITKDIEVCDDSNNINIGVKEAIKKSFFQYRKNKKQSDKQITARYENLCSDIYILQQYKILTNAVGLAALPKKRKRRSNTHPAIIHITTDAISIRNL